MFYFNFKRKLKQNGKYIVKKLRLTLVVLFCNFFLNLERDKIRKTVQFCLFLSGTLTIKYKMIKKIIFCIYRQNYTNYVVICYFLKISSFSLFSPELILAFHLLTARCRCDAKSKYLLT